MKLKENTVKELRSVLANATFGDSKIYVVIGTSKIPVDSVEITEPY